LSTSSSPHDPADCRDLHADAFLVKPLGLDGVLARAVDGFGLQRAEPPSPEPW
jgi:hypothetical protein